MTREASKYKEYPNMQITGAEAPFRAYEEPQRPMPTEIHTVKLRLYADGIISAYEPGKHISMLAFETFNVFCGYWNIINRRVLIEKTGFYV